MRIILSLALLSSCSVSNRDEYHNGTTSAPFVYFCSKQGVEYIGFYSHMIVLSVDQDGKPVRCTPFI